MSNGSDIGCTKIKTHILCSVTIFENRAFHSKVEKYGTARQTTDDYMAHAHCVVDT